MRRFEAFLSRQRASVRKFYMYYCSIIRLIDNVSMDMSKSKHLVVQFTENLKECEHNMDLYFNERKILFQDGSIERQLYKRGVRPAVRA